MPMSSDQERCCANCGAAWRRGTQSCDQCGGEFAWEVIPSGGVAAAIPTSRFQLSVGETMHAMAIVAVCLATAQLSIWLCVFAVAIVSVATIRSGVQIDERWRTGNPVKAGETMRMFWQSVVVVAAAMLAFVLIASFCLAVGVMLMLPMLHFFPRWAGTVAIGYIAISHLAAVVYLCRRRGFAVSLLFGCCGGIGFTMIMAVMLHLGFPADIGLPSYRMWIGLPLFLAICCTLGCSCFRDGLGRAMSFYTGFSLTLPILAAGFATIPSNLAIVALVAEASLALLPVLVTLMLLEEHWRALPTSESDRSTSRLD
ncbi:MAG: hypothetical protein ACI9G1_002670 [Pirellulaceae bacterium]|jgi:hypothetical protein